MTTNTEFCDDPWRDYEIAAEAVKTAFEQIKRAYQWPSCSSCLHTILDEDMSVGIWLHIEDCNLGFPNIPNELLDDYDLEELASTCGKWEFDFDSFC